MTNKRSFHSGSFGVGGGGVEYSDASLGLPRRGSLPSSSGIVGKSTLITPCNKRRKFELPSLRCQMISPAQPERSTTSTTEKISTQSKANIISTVNLDAAITTTSTTHYDTSGASHNNKILEMISKLKMVDYWKYLPAESWWQGNHNKENESGEEEEEDDDEEQDNHDDDSHPFCCFVVSGSPQSQDRSETVSSNIETQEETTLDCGFVIQEITDEGWICVTACSSSTISLLSRPHADNEQQQRHCQRQQRHLLRLPAKVAKSATPGMKIVGIDLWERVNNGVLEPCLCA
mmetsp:Transcript_17292/g.42010  ORF Transcript_17292/g.42010 Transcript_17292/m.42010 type:complete len:290 (+) Transcript_17292:351-1220(+)